VVHLSDVSDADYVQKDSNCLMGHLNTHVSCNNNNFIDNSHNLSFNLVDKYNCYLNFSNIYII
jgi:hypothetical protein